MRWKDALFPIVLMGMVFMVTACQTNTAGRLNTAYHAAVVDAALAQEDEISNSLLSVSQENDQLLWNEDGNKVLVVTWKARQAYEQFFKPYTATSDKEDYVVWVTLAPQVRRFCSDYLSITGSSKENLELKLKQYLGLNHEWNYDVFVEMWVSPDDLFRPCVDPATTDTSCDLHFGDNTPAVRNINDYQEFYKNIYYKSFRSSAGVPWTGLGYTYDWGSNGSKIGASEFILVPNAAYQIRKVIPTMEYCREKG